MCTRMIFAAVLSLTIKIFHRHLGPNLYIFTVKVSLTFFRDFMTYHREKNTDQSDFVLKIAVHTVYQHVNKTIHKHVLLDGTS